MTRSFFNACGVDTLWDGRKHAPPSRLCQTTLSSTTPDKSSVTNSSLLSLRISERHTRILHCWTKREAYLTDTGLKIKKLSLLLPQGTSVGHDIRKKAKIF